AVDAGGVGCGHRGRTGCHRYAALVPQCGGMVRRSPCRMARTALDSALALTRRPGSAGSRPSGDSSLARGPLLPLLGSVPDVLMQISNPLISPHFLEANNTSATPP